MMKCNGHSFRLMLIVPWFDIGGVEHFHLQLIRQLRKRGWETAVVATRYGEHAWMPRFQDVADRVHVVNSKWSVSGCFNDLRKWITEFSPQAILIGHSELGYLTLPLLRRSFPATAILDFTHLEEPWLSGGFARYSAGLNRYLDRCMTSSLHLKDWMTGRGAEPGNIDVCTTNIDTRFWCPRPGIRVDIRHQHRIAPDEVVIFFAGRLCQQKQPRVLIRVLHELNRRGVDFHAVIAGEGPDFIHLRDYIDEHQLGCVVELAGPLEIEGVRDWMAASDIFFLPSENEGIALTLYEAMSMGLAVLGTDVGGQRELVTESCGILMEPVKSENARIRAFSEALEGLVLGRDQRRSMGAAARDRMVKNFDIERMGDQVDDILKDVIRSSALFSRVPPRESFAHRWSAAAADFLKSRDIRVFTAPLREDLRNPVNIPAEMIFHQFITGLVAEQVAMMPSWKCYERVIRLFPSFSEDGMLTESPPENANQAFEKMLCGWTYHLFRSVMWLGSICSRLRRVFGQ